ncbi:MAG: aminoglycoside phosphotransferase family protein [Granulosicoccus sp.]
MHTRVNSDLYTRLYQLCQQGGLSVNDTTEISFSEQGRIHQVYLLQTGCHLSVIQCLNPRVINDATALERLTNTVLAPALLAPQLLPWPATGSCVLATSEGSWVNRSYIEGEALTTKLDVALFEAMANTLKHFHKSLSVMSLLQSGFTGVDPWSGDAAESLRRRVDGGDVCSSIEQEVLVTWASCRNKISDTDWVKDNDNVVVHRDAKPSNFILRPNGSLTLIDFDTIGIGDPAMDLGEIMRAWLSSDESDTNIGLNSISTSDSVCDGNQFRRKLLTNSVDCTLALKALETGYKDDDMTTHRIKQSAMQCCLIQCERFLQDHFMNDQYYRVRNHGDNLLRAIKQIEAWKILDGSAPIEP